MVSLNCISSVLYIPHDLYGSYTVFQTEFPCTGMCMALYSAYTWKPALLHSYNCTIVQLYNKSSKEMHIIISHMHIPHNLTCLEHFS